jgi:DNA-binding CsgD family transcriptional regulator
MARPRTRDERDLTPAEARIYWLIVERGLRDREIATETGYTLGSVKQAIAHVLEKIGVRSRVQLAVWHYTVVVGLKARR